MYGCLYYNVNLKKTLHYERENPNNLTVLRKHLAIVGRKNSLVTGRD